MTQSFILHAVKDGRFDDRRRILDNARSFIGRLPASKSWEITVSPWHKPRSDKQRRALFGVAYKALMEHMGLRGEEEKEELHRYFCGEFFGTKTDALGRQRPARTTTKDENGNRDEISTAVAMEFYALIQQKAAEVGIDVPDPEVTWREE